MTTNIGAEQIVGRDAFGFQKKDAAATYEKMKAMLKQEMERNFRPEFLNRVDDIIVFRSLTDEDMSHIIDIELSKVSKRLQEKGFTLVMTDEAKELLIEKGWNPDMGARPLKRAIQSMIEDTLAEELLAGRVKAGDTVIVDRQGQELGFRTAALVESASASSV
jgi:ATP-dependent Clp protease ATP-binding subunit ClpC